MDFQWNMKVSLWISWAMAFYSTFNTDEARPAKVFPTFECTAKPFSFVVYGMHAWIYLMYLRKTLAFCFKSRYSHLPLSNSLAAKLSKPLNSSTKSLTINPLPSPFGLIGWFPFSAHIQPWSLFVLSSWKIMTKFLRRGPINGYAGISSIHMGKGACVRARTSNRLK